MTKEEFLKRVKENEEWAPGWETIEQEFERLYPGQEPRHYGTNMMARAIFGGDCYLDGYSIYEESFGGEWNKWGYEMTIKLREKEPEDCLWAIDMLSNLARYTYTQNQFFLPSQYIAGNGTSLHVGTDSAITALITTMDTEAVSQDSVYGKTEFIQLVGITEQEFKNIQGKTANIELLLERMKQDNPDLVTDMTRTSSYL